METVRRSSAHARPLTRTGRGGPGHSRAARRAPTSNLQGIQVGDRRGPSVYAGVRAVIAAIFCRERECGGLHVLI
jgi:hypothetical protein